MKARFQFQKEPANPEDPWYLLLAGGRVLKEIKRAIRFARLCHLSQQYVRIHLEAVIAF